MAAALPTGTVTFLFTDIEGSTQLLHRLGETYATILTDHQRLLRQAWADHGGVEVDTAGDGFFVAFPTAPAAVAAAAAATRALAEHAWPDGTSLRVRMGLHTGSPQVVGERYVGLDVHRAARIAAAGHGGQILLSPTTRELVMHFLPDGVTLQDLGTYQLKDFPEPAPIFQLVLPGLPDTFPRLKTLDRPPHDLPPRAPGFVGRDADVQMLCATLRQGQEQGTSAAIVGMGGLGKSSLAAEAVHVLASPPPSFPGGTTWVRCDDRVGWPGLCWVEDQLLAAWGASLPDDVTDRAATAEAGIELRERALRARLRPSASAAPALALVVLDNVERELPLPRLLETVTPLGITTLLTTRSEPASPRVRLLRLETLAQDPGVSLFAERYTARGGNWAGERDEATTKTIVDALGGLPLAIELAAARAARTGLPLAALAEELHAPDALERLGDPLDPSASVRYSLGKTLTALSPTQRVRFAALGLLEGPDWPRAVVESLFAGVPAVRPEDTPPGTQPTPAARADLEVLLAFSLARLATVDVAGTQSAPRVRLHPLVRELAREQWVGLSAAEQEAALHALLAGIQAWMPTFFSSSAYLQLALDEELIASALRTAAVRQVEPQLLISIIDGWAIYLSLYRNRLNLEMQTLKLECARTLEDGPAELAALHAVGSESGALGRQDEAARYLGEALALARERGARVEMTSFLCDVGDMLAESGSRANAEQMYEEANALVRELGDHLVNWGMLMHLGSFAADLGRSEESGKWYRRALEMARTSGNQVAELKTQCEIGLMWALHGEFERARKHLDEGVAAAREFGDPAGIGVLLNDRGHLELMTGEFEAASDDLTEALPLLTRVPDRALAVRGNLAILDGLQARQQGNREAAEQAFEEALRFFAQSIMPAFAERIRYVHHLLADLREPPAVGAAAGGSAASPMAELADATPRSRHHWWPLGRRDRQV
jgi:class 3 adenylate cyclase/tetratricopeptide (TPR) repeat protein